LTPTEEQIARLISTGLSNNPDIASRTFTSRRTLQFHVSSILTKLQLTDRTQAAIFGLQQRLVPLDEALLEE